MQLIILEHPRSLLLQIKTFRAPSSLLFLEEKQCKIKVTEVSLTDRLGGSFKEMCCFNEESP